MRRPAELGAGLAGGMIDPRMPELPTWLLELDCDTPLRHSYVFDRLLFAFGQGRQDHLDQPAFGRTFERRGPLLASRFVGDVAPLTAGVSGFFGEWYRRMFWNPGDRLVTAISNPDHLTVSLFMWRPGDSAWKGFALHSDGLPGGAAIGPLVHFANGLGRSTLLQTVVLVPDPATASAVAMRLRGQGTSVVSFVRGCQVPLDFGEFLAALGVGVVCFAKTDGWQFMWRQVAEMRQQCEMSGIVFHEIDDLRSLFFDGDAP